MVRMGTACEAGIGAVQAQHIGIDPHGCVMDIVEIERIGAGTAEDAVRGTPGGINAVQKIQHYPVGYRKILQHQHHIGIAVLKLDAFGILNLRGHGDGSGRQQGQT